MANIFESILRYVPGFKHFFKNFSIVDERLTRSAQLTTKQLEIIIKKHNIKTFVSLIRPEPNKRWYQDEIKLLKRLGIDYSYLEINYNGYPTQEDVGGILKLIQSSEYPMHVECRQGADRVGLFCAVYCFLKGNDKEHILKQVSFLGYGNVINSQRRFVRDLLTGNCPYPLPTTTFK